MVDQIEAEGLRREVADAPSFQILKVRLDGALRNLI